MGKKIELFIYFKIFGMICPDNSLTGILYGLPKGHEANPPFSDI